MHVGRELRIRFEPARLFEAFARQLRCQVEEERRHAGIRAVQRNLRAHRSGTEHRHRVDDHARAFFVRDTH